MLTRSEDWHVSVRTSLTRRLKIIKPLSNTIRRMCMAYLSLCHIQKEDYEAAKEDWVRFWQLPPNIRAYLMRGEVSQNRTIRYKLAWFWQSHWYGPLWTDGWGQEPLYVSSRESIKRLKLIWTSLSIWVQRMPVTISTVPWRVSIRIIWEAPWVTMIRFWYWSE